MATANAILQDALDLSTEERAELALRLMESLDEEPAEEVEAAWAAEVKTRVESLRRGELATRPAAEVFRDARARLATHE